MPRVRPAGLAALVSVMAAVPLVLSAGPASSLAGEQSTDASLGYTAQVTVGDHTRGCSGVLVDPEWVLTAASCFVADPAAGTAVPAGPPQEATTVTVGSPDLTSAGAEVRDVVELVPRSDRDLVMARLAQPVTDVTPVVVASTAPAAGESLLVGGFGRTADAWVPDTLHTGTFTVAGVDGNDVSLTSSGGTVCMGDAGGPALRVDGGTAELVALNSRSWQGGCYDSSATSTDAVDTRVDDLRSWIDQVRLLPERSMVASGDFNGDGRADVAALYDNGVALDGGNRTSLYTFLSGGSSFAAPARKWISVSGFTWSKSRLVAGDFNGDGKDDLAVLYDGGKDADGRSITSLYTFTSTGSGFNPPVKTWTSEGVGGFTWTESLPVAGDFNGDGKDDVAVLYESGPHLTSLFTFTSKGTSFSAPVKSWTTPTDSSFTWSASRPVAGDFNGDGKDDVAVLYESGPHLTSLYTFTSNGTGFSAPVKSWTTPTDSSFTWSASLPTAGDFNGDGKDDVAILYNVGPAADGTHPTSAFTLTSTGTAFTLAKTWTSTGSFEWSLSQVTAGDYNGDGRADMGVLYDEGTEPDGRKHDGLYVLPGAGTAKNWWNGTVV